MPIIKLKTGDLMLLFSRKNMTKHTFPFPEDNLNDETKNYLWSAINLSIFEKVYCSPPLFKFKYNNSDVYNFIINLYEIIIKKPFAKESDNWNKTKEEIKTFFFESPFPTHFDFIEFIFSNYPKNLSKEKKSFLEQIRGILIREKSNFTIVNEKIVQRILPSEKEAFERSLLNAGETVASHLKQSANLICNSNSEYKKSIDEALWGLKNFFEEFLNCTTADFSNSILKLCSKHKINFNIPLLAATDFLHSLTLDSLKTRHNFGSKSILSCIDNHFIIMVSTSITSYLYKKSGETEVTGLNKNPNMGNIIAYLAENQNIRLLDAIVGLKNIFSNFSQDFNSIYNNLYYKSSPGFDESVCTLALVCHTINFFMEKID